jgi:hypothetical protein
MNRGIEKHPNTAESKSESNVRRLFSDGVLKSPQLLRFNASSDLR